MAGQAMGELLKSELLEIIDETFERVHGIYLDRGTSLFETLATITAEQASRPVSARCASIAAQVNHVRFYLEVLHDALQQKEIGKVNWDASWEIAPVTPESWETLKTDLQTTYQKLLTTIQGIDNWEGETEIAGTLAIVVHTAYHLGEIRQALCTIAG